MKYLLFVAGLSFTYFFGCAQTADTTGRAGSSTTNGEGRVSDTAARKLTLKERRQQEMLRMWNERERLMHMKPAERLAATEARPYYRADSAHWSLSFNPLGVYELQSALGLGVGYQFNRYLQIWLESSALFQTYPGATYSCRGGIREILALKYYFGPRQSLFFAGEFRYKDVYYHGVDEFFDNINDTFVRDYTAKVEDIILGGGVWFGGQIRISSNHRWRLEPNIGLGLKGRTVVWHGLPRGYTRVNESDIRLYPDPGQTPKAPMVYFPATVRFVYVL
ncbi:MAG TPA: hypothetical protein VMH27_16580 [Puia sp.]|nr:hypothetical protein [Puia sp.]